MAGTGLDVRPLRRNARSGRACRSKGTVARPLRRRRKPFQSSGSHPQALVPQSDAQDHIGRGLVLDRGQPPVPRRRRMLPARSSGTVLRCRDGRARELVPVPRRRRGSCLQVVLVDPADSASGRPVAEARVRSGARERVGRGVTDSEASASGTSAARELRLASRRRRGRFGARVEGSASARPALTGPRLRASPRTLRARFGVARCRASGLVPARGRGSWLLVHRTSPTCPSGDSGRLQGYGTKPDDD